MVRLINSCSVFTWDSQGILKTFYTFKFTPLYIFQCFCFLTNLFNFFCSFPSSSLSLFHCVHVYFRQHFYTPIIIYSLYFPIFFFEILKNNCRDFFKFFYSQWLREQWQKKIARFYGQSEWSEPQFTAHYQPHKIHENFPWGALSLFLTCGEPSSGLTGILNVNFSVYFYFHFFLSLHETYFSKKTVISIKKKWMNFKMHIWFAPGHKNSLFFNFFLCVPTVEILLSTPFDNWLQFQ